MHRWLLTLALCALCSPVLAEEAPAPSATTTSPATAAPAPAATSPAAAVPAPQPSPAPAVKDEPKEKAEELHDFTLVRIDLEDGFELHPWGYHEFRLTEHWGILGTLHFQLPGLSDRQAPFAELDIGPNLHVGDFQINPQIGFDLVWAANAQGEKRTTAWDVMPQLYVLYSAGRFNAEFWNMFFIPFNGDPASYQGRLLASVRVGRPGRGPARRAQLGPRQERGGPLRRRRRSLVRLPLGDRGPVPGLRDRAQGPGDEAHLPQGAVAPRATGRSRRSSCRT